jgi:hypothetical protein
MKYLKNVINGALSDIKKIRACPGHVWVGPIKEVDVNLGDGVTFYEVHCKHCPLGKSFITKADAEEAIRETKSDV